jgi:hypothetical protein
VASGATRLYASCRLVGREEGAGPVHVADRGPVAVEEAVGVVGEGPEARRAAVERPVRVVHVSDVGEQPAPCDAGVSDWRAELADPHRNAGRVPAAEVPEHGPVRLVEDGEGRLQRAETRVPEAEEGRESAPADDVLVRREDGAGHEHCEQADEPEGEGRVRVVCDRGAADVPRLLDPDEAGDDCVHGQERRAGDDVRRGGSVALDCPVLVPAPQTEHDGEVGGDEEEREREDERPVDGGEPPRERVDVGGEDVLGPVVAEVLHGAEVVREREAGDDDEHGGVGVADGGVGEERRGLPVGVGVVALAPRDDGAVLVVDLVADVDADDEGVAAVSRGEQGEGGDPGRGGEARGVPEALRDALAGADPPGDAVVVVENDHEPPPSERRDLAVEHVERRRDVALRTVDAGDRRRVRRWILHHQLHRERDAHAVGAQGYDAVRDGAAGAPVEAAGDEGLHVRAVPVHAAQTDGGMRSRRDNLRVVAVQPGAAGRHKRNQQKR